MFDRHRASLKFVKTPYISDKKRYIILKQSFFYMLNIKFIMTNGFDMSVKMHKLYIFGVLHVDRIIIENGVVR